MANERVHIRRIWADDEGRNEETDQFSQHAAVQE